MPDPIYPDPAPSPPLARPDAVRVVSDRLLARAATRQGTPAATIAPGSRSAPGVESPLPASLGPRDEVPSSRPHAIDPPDASSAAPTVTAPAAIGAVEVGPLAVARPAGLGESNERAERPMTWGAARGPVAPPSVVSGRPFDDPPGLALPEGRGSASGDGGSPLPPTASITARTPFALSLDAAGEPEGPGLGPGRDPSQVPTDHLPRVRPQRPDALAGGIADLFEPARSTRPLGGGDLASGSAPTDEEVFAAATGVGPAGGTGSMGMDLTRTNELLQQVVDALRKQPSGISSSMPSGGADVYAERY